MSTGITLEPPLDHAQTPYQRFAPSRIIGRMSVEEYLNFLEKAIYKYDYVQGEVVQMAGASPEHNLIAANTLRSIGNSLEAIQSDCEVLGSDQRVAVNNRLYYFPDLVIVCGEWHVDSRGALQNPLAIIEVLSPTTELDDRTDKFREYQQINSLQHYILIEQRRVAVTHYVKLEVGVWAIWGDYREITDTITMELGDKSITYRLTPLLLCP